MSRFNRALLWMSAFLVLVAVLAALVGHRLLEIFSANPFFNGVILTVLLAGIVVNLRQVIVLGRESHWMETFRRSNPERAVEGKPRLLAPMARMLGNRARGKAALSAPSMRTILDSVQSRLEESRDLSRYLIGLAIFLGLLGTFWGLLGTIAAVGQVIDGLEVGSGDFAGVFAELKRGLQAPLGGMGTAFSSSLFGLGGSLVLGFLDLQAGHAQNRFFNGLEEWLSGVTQLVDDLGVPPLATATLAEPALAEPALAEPTPSGEPDDATLRLLIETIRSERQLIEALLTRHAAPLAAEPDRPEA